MELFRAALKRHFWTRYVTLAPYRLLLCAKHSVLGVPESGNLHNPGYAELILQRYLSFAGPHGFHGKVAEVGPGAATDVAELLLAHGAAAVDQIDRFFAAKGHNRITRYVASAETFFREHGEYDFILSNAVLEHLHDPLVALRAMVGALSPGGMMIHFIDLRDHGAFSPALHDLSFLRLPDWLYWPLIIQGGPNRIRTRKYRELLASLPVKSTIYPTTFVGSNDEFWLRPTVAPESLIAQSIKRAKEFQPHLAARFADESPEELAVNGVAIVARRN